MVSDSTRLAADALLVSFGTAVLLSVGAALTSEGATPLRPAALVGVALVFAGALAAVRAAGRIDDLDAWIRETRRGRAAVLAAAGLFVAVRFGVGFLPPGARRALLVCVFGASAGAVLLGAGDLLRRALEA
ncbi:hypothetical protein [Halosegnis marinus]|uniref:Uncharacterized protein n=1 Tax=Halosegnis marinus TaxID=3034023 RepID=A0ABD5ZPA1_9EURY|nr:hypothetical protein [Halosegnis sp. DT85]